MTNVGMVALFGVVIGLLICIPIYKMCNKNNKVKTEYDERQEVIRGRGFKYANYTSWALLGIAIVAELNEINLHMENSLILFTILIVSALVQITYSIWNDAYWGRNNNIKNFVITFVIVTIINMASAIVAFVEGEMIVDGIMTWKGINLECALMIIIVGIEFAVRNIIQKNDIEEEEE